MKYNEYEYDIVSFRQRFIVFDLLFICVLVRPAFEAVVSYWYIMLLETLITSADKEILFVVLYEEFFLFFIVLLFQ